MTKSTRPGKRILWVDDEIGLLKPHLLFLQARGYHVDAISNGDDALDLLARGDDDPERLADDWAAEELPKLSDPTQAEHTLRWLFDRSARGLDDTGREILAFYHHAVYVQLDFRWRMNKS